MSKFITGTRAQCDQWKTDIDIDAGMPQRGVTFGGPDRAHPTVPGPGWSTTVTADVLEENPGQCCLEVPDDRLVHLGKRGVPASGVDLTDLPVPLRTRARRRRGLDADGNPLPFPGAAAVEKADK